MEELLSKARRRNCCSGMVQRSTAVGAWPSGGSCLYARTNVRRVQTVRAPRTDRGRFHMVRWQFTDFSVRKPPNVTR